MKSNEITGMVFILIFVALIGVVIGSVANSRGYDSGYADAEAGKGNRWDVRYDYRYPDTMWPANNSYDNYLNHSGKIMKGGGYNERIGTSGTFSKTDWNETLQDRGEAETYFKPDRDTQNVQWKNLQSVGWVLQGILYFGFIGR